MRTYVINKIEELKQFETENGFKIDGNLECKCSLVIDKNIAVEGYLYIEAGRHIESGGYIKAGGAIESGRYIKAGGYIKAGWAIEAGGYIKAGDIYGISAGLSISCCDILKFGSKCFAGICIWRETSDEEKTITCGKFEGGVIAYGTLKEIGIKSDKVKITCEGKTVEISRESAIALNLIKED